MLGRHEKCAERGGQTRGRLHAKRTDSDRATIPSQLPRPPIKCKYIFQLTYPKEMQDQ